MTRSPGLSVQTYNAIVEGIISGLFHPGQRLILERVAEQLGVSVTPVREAVVRLVQEGLVTEEEPFRRLRVVPLTEEYVSSTYQVRAALEGLAAELAARRVTSEDVQALRQILAGAEKSLAQERFQAFLDADRSFHDAVLVLASNGVLNRSMRALHNHIMYIRGYCQRRSSSHFKFSHTEHLEVMKAIEAGDARAARQSMEIHNLQTGERVVRLLNFEPIHSN
jgi:DNA-binding GntR family transcriptional regulator